MVTCDSMWGVRKRSPVLAWWCQGLPGGAVLCSPALGGGQLLTCSLWKAGSPALGAASAWLHIGRMAAAGSRAGTTQGSGTQGGGENGDVGAGAALGVVQVRQRGQAFLSLLPVHGQLCQGRVLELGHSSLSLAIASGSACGPPPTHRTPRPQGWREGQIALYGRVRVQLETLVKRASELCLASCRRTQRLNRGVP